MARSGTRSVGRFVPESSPELCSQHTRIPHAAPPTPPPPSPTLQIHRVEINRDHNGLTATGRRVNIGKTSCKMSYLLGAPYGAVFELDGNQLVRVDGELVEAEEEPPGEDIELYRLRSVDLKNQSRPKGANVSLPSGELRCGSPGVEKAAPLCTFRKAHGSTLCFGYMCVWTQGRWNRARRRPRQRTRGCRTTAGSPTRTRRRSSRRGTFCR